MRKLFVVTALALAAFAGFALACGRYGPPQRAERAAKTPPSVPLTDPAVPQ